MTWAEADLQFEVAEEFGGYQHASEYALEAELFKRAVIRLEQERARHAERRRWVSAHPALRAEALRQKKSQPFYLKKHPAPVASACARCSAIIPARTGSGNRARFCSRACRPSARPARRPARVVTQTCVRCGVATQAPRKGVRAKFCSEKCRIRECEQCGVSIRSGDFGFPARTCSQRCRDRRRSQLLKERSG